MAPSFVLVVVSLLARAAGALAFGPLDSWTASIALGLSAMFVLSASSHFIQPRRDGLISIVPRRVPRPGLVVTLTGMLEFTGAIGLLVPALRTAAAVCLGLLLMAIFPANVRASQGKRHAAAPTTPLGLRAALQVVFLAACTVVAAGTA